MEPIDAVFMSHCAGSIRMMRTAGLNEIQISCIVTDIRSAGISEEYRRIQELQRINPPKHYRNQEVEKVIKDWYPPEIPLT